MLPLSALMMVLFHKFVVGMEASSEECQYVVVLRYLFDHPSGGVKVEVGCVLI